MNYWLFKSEPDAFSIDDLAAMPGKRDHWDGIRNYQARNFMREMNKGDLGFFYHSSCAVPGVIGTMEIVRTSYPDFTALDRKSNYFDVKASEEKNLWSMVDVKYKRKFKQIVSLSQLREEPALAGMTLLKKGNRLSIMPISEAEWLHINEMGLGKR